MAIRVGFTGTGIEREGNMSNDTREVPIKWPDPVEGPFTVVLHWRELAGRLEVTGLCIEADQPLKATDLRSLPIGAMIDRTAPKALTIYAPVATATADAPIPRRVRRVVTEENLRRVADTYTAAWAAHLDPTKAVAAAEKMAHSTASRWIILARRAGLLPATKRGVPAGRSS
jgi:hypothetical protein